uniref:Putative plant transposon protein domain-containing protein n=1 Tax=Fagus sylvatica TaxID=28930 RepID=A0A2N9ECR0_FAGSY
MAPKKSVSSEDPRKKRLKSKASRDEPPSLDKSFASSEYLVRFHDDISRRTVVFGKIVDFPYFANHHIHIRELFQAQGWENFLSTRQKQYTTLVKHFYTHFQLIHGKISSYVKGKSISLPHSTLASILGVPRTGAQRYTTNSWVQFEGYDPLESIRQMCGNPNIQELSRPKIADLTLESRLIHHIIAHNILPRSGSYEYTSYLDLFIMWAILNKVKLDLAFYISLAHGDLSEAAGNEEPMQEDQEPRSAPSGSSRVNEDNFQLVLGRLDSLATSMGNIQTSIDNFSAMVTRKFSTYDEQFGTLETSIQEINERLINQGI